MVEWNVDNYGFLLLVMTTSEQKPLLNKEHLNLIAKYLLSMVKRINHLQENTTSL